MIFGNQTGLVRTGNPDPARKMNWTGKVREYQRAGAGEIPEPKTACHACGKKGSWYVEKYTAERRSRPKDKQEARRICRSCYNESQKYEQMASVPLPGTVSRVIMRSRWM